MPKTSLTQAAVHQVCEQIYITIGKDPTYEDIQKILGGSNSTIKPFLQSWLELPRPARWPVPGAIAAKANHLTQVIWASAMTAARQVAEESEQKREQALSQRERELEIAIQEISALERQRDGLAAEVGSLIEERAELRIHLKGVEQLAAQLQTSQAAERTVREQCERARDELNLARGQMQAMQRQIDQLSHLKPPRNSKPRLPQASGHSTSAASAS